MKFDRATMVGVLASGLVLVVACSSSDTTPSGTSGGTSGTSGGTSGTSGSDSGTSGSVKDSGTSGVVTDSGTSGTSGDSGQAETGGGTKANGATCAGDTDCMSGHCLSQGGGGGAAAGMFCTIPCTMPGQLGDPACAVSTIYTGKCSGASLCQVK